MVRQQLNATQVRVRVVRQNIPVDKYFKKMLLDHFLKTAEGSLTGQSRYPSILAVSRERPRGFEDPEDAKAGLEIRILMTETIGWHTR